MSLHGSLAVPPRPQPAEVPGLAYFSEPLVLPRPPLSTAPERTLDALAQMYGYYSEA